MKKSSKNRFKLNLADKNLDNLQNMKWISTISTDPDLDIAMDEILNKVTASDYDIALFFVSSIYEATAYSYDIIFKSISN